MWPDPFKNRKPVSLGGTPANKFSIIFSLSTIAIFFVTINLIRYTPHMQKKLKSLEQVFIESEKKKEIRLYLSDPLIQGALGRKAKEYEEESKHLGWE